MNRLVDFHQNYKENSLTHRRFKHSDIQPLIDNCGFTTENLGKSYEGRDIRKIRVGSGKTKILLWSQMHGNEATATMAIFDILNFLKSKDKTFAELRENILNKLELHFIPMLNPDGAQRFQRLTAQEIDMNRDAVALQCPESRILKTLVLSLHPDFSFNLHDQAIYYAAGESPNQAAISFLATAFNPEKDWNEVRTQSMQVIASMNEDLQQIIPDKVGRFSDDFEPRAFGDNIQKWGSSLILIESGGYGEDTEKQWIRTLNFHIILNALHSISNRDYTSFSLKDYEKIPQNSRILFDLKIKNITVKDERGDYQVDLGILNEEKNNETFTAFSYLSVIEELGDLSTFYGIKTIDAKGGILKSLKTLPDWEQKDPLTPDFPGVGKRASFLIDFGHQQTLIINGEML